MDFKVSFYFIFFNTNLKIVGLAQEYIIIFPPHCSTNPFVKASPIPVPCVLVEYRGLKNLTPHTIFYSYTIIFKIYGNIIFILSIISCIILGYQSVKLYLILHLLLRKKIFQNTAVSLKVQLLVLFNLLTLKQIVISDKLRPLLSCLFRLIHKFSYFPVLYSLQSKFRH